MNMTGTSLLTSMQDITRTTRTPVFWGYPPPPHDYPYHWVILDPKSKDDKVKVTNFKNSPKFQSDEYCWRYRADTILSTDGQTDRRTDGQGDTSIPPINFVEAGGIITDYPIKSQFCTTHDSWAVVICANLWLDWIIRIITTVKTIFISFQLWTNRSSVKWFLGQHKKKLFLS